MHSDSVGIIAAVVTLTLGFLLFALLVRLAVRKAVHGDAEIRRRRKAAILSGPLGAGVPFELSGVGRAGELMVHLDLDVTVPWPNGLATLDKLGVDVDYEVWVNGEKVDTVDIRMPARCRDRKHLLCSETLEVRSRIRHVCRVDKLHRMRDGAHLVIRGTAKPVPRTEVGNLTLWVG